MPVTIFMNEAGGGWIENPQGDLLAECFFKAEDETAEELRQMGVSGAERVLSDGADCRRQGDCRGRHGGPVSGVLAGPEALTPPPHRDSAC